MDRMTTLIGATIGGWSGFGLGTLVSTLSGVVLASLGVAAGVYAAHLMGSSST